MEHHTTANEETFWEFCVTQYISLPRLVYDATCHMTEMTIRMGLSLIRLELGPAQHMCNVHSVTPLCSATTTQTLQITNHELLRLTVRMSNNEGLHSIKSLCCHCVG